MTTKRPARFEIRRSKRGVYFRVVAANGRILCHSETYRSVAACRRSAAAVLSARPLKV